MAGARVGQSPDQRALLVFGLRQRVARMSTMGERLPVVIRALRGRDVPSLLRMRQDTVRLDLPEAQVRGYTPMRGVAESRWFALGHGRVRTYVACVDGQPSAFVQVRERSSRQRHKWDILHLGAALPDVAARPRRTDLWTPLLDYTTAAAGRRGVQRLYAKLPVQLEVAEAFRAAGYVRYGQETVYLLQGRADLAATGAQEGLAVLPRPQAPDDTWAVHQLYTLTAPKPAQHAEAYTSHNWELPQRWPLLSRGTPREWGFIVERGHELAIYCRVGRQGKRSRLEFMFEPAARDMLPVLLDALLRWLAPGPGERLYCTMHEYQAELDPVLTARGFAPVGLQDLLVRYTTVSARATAPLTLARPAREGRLVGVPAQPQLRWHPEALAVVEATTSGLANVS
jgi:hypothetical protein